MFLPLTAHQLVFKELTRKVMVLWVYVKTHETETLNMYTFLYANYTTIHCKTFFNYKEKGNVKAINF